MIAAIETAELTTQLAINRIVIGCWQATPAFGLSHVDLLDTYARFVEAGLATFDVADIYPGTESLMGELRRRAGDGGGALRVLTKLVPNATEIATLDAAGIEARVDRALTLLGTDSIDLLQLHWWDYALLGIERFTEALMRLRERGKIAALGATNFNSRETAALIARGFALSSMQVQYSLLDRRASNSLARLAEDHGFGIICYGALAGGLLSERWLGAIEPSEAETPSLAKYLLVVRAFGGWAAYQALLATVHEIAQAHAVDIASVVLRWLLDRPGVAAVIVGARSAESLPSLLRVAGLRLTSGDREAIGKHLDHNPGPEGDTYDLERQEDGILSETKLAQRKNP